MKSEALNPNHGRARARLAGWLSAALVLATPSFAHTPLNQTYTYDDAGRLSSVSDGTTSITYQYDGASNLLVRTVPEPGGGGVALASLAAAAWLRRRRRSRVRPV